MNRIKTILFFGVLFLCLSGKNQFIPTHLSTTNGLPTNTHYAVGFDHKNKLWISSDKGIHSFNGRSIVSPPIDDKYIDDEVFFFYEDSKKRKWLVNYNGQLSYLSQYDDLPNNKKRKTLSCSPKGFIKQVLEYKEEVWFFFTKDQYAYVYNGNKIRKVKVVPEGGSVLGAHKYKESLHIFSIAGLTDTVSHTIIFNQGIIKSSIKFSSTRSFRYKICPVGDNRVLFPYHPAKTSPTYERFGLLNLETNEVTDLSLKELDRNAINNIQFEENKLFVSTTNGVFSYDYKEGGFIFYSQFLKNRNTTSIAIDYEGYLWVSTMYNGTFRVYNKASVRKITEKESRQILYDEDKIKIIEESRVLECNGNNDLSLYWQNKSNLDLLFFKKIGNNKYAIGEGASLIIKENEIENRFYNLAGTKDVIAHNGNLYVGRYNSIIKISNLDYKKREVLSDDRCNVLAELNDKLYCSSNTTIYTIDLKTNKKKELFPFSASKLLVSNNYLYIATRLNGVYRFDGSDTIRLQTKSYLPKNSLVQNIKVFKDSIYILTDKGFLICNKKLEVIFNSSNYRLPVFNIKDAQQLEESLFLSTSSGVVVINLKSLEKKNLYSPKVFISAFSADTINYLNNKDVKFKHNNNNVSIKYEVVNYSSPYETNYRYKINAREDWVYTKSTEVLLSDLLPNTYTFEIQSRIIDATWSESTLYPFTILPAFYQTVWFKLVLVILVILLILLTIRWYIKSNKRKAEMNWKLAEYQHKAFRAQLNPHFLFNVLHSIQHFYLKNDFTSGHVYLSKFSKLIRKILNQSDKNTAFIYEEVELIKQYVEMEQLRVETPFEFEINYEPKLAKIEIPSMLIQPFVENAIWHGVNNKEQGQIKVLFTQENRTLKIEVSDNGNGFDVSKLTTKRDKGVHAISLNKRRIDMINQFRKNKITLGITSGSNGTFIKIKIPLDND